MGVTYAAGHPKEQRSYSNSQQQLLQLDNNHHYGPGDQYNGLNDIQNGIQQRFHLHLPYLSRPASPLEVIALVIIVLVIIGLGLGLGLGLGYKQDHGAFSDTKSTAILPVGSSTASLPPTTTSASMASTTASGITSTTPAPAMSECTWGCLPEFLQTDRCRSGCPGASCLDDNGCANPWPCYSNTCCRTGCLPGWSCDGTCMGGLACVKAPKTITTAESTCEVAATA
ncbi:hypothetical protein F4808DRAFT_415586 [Astrocystis sublimbata]|nr:hypothetical protein F4808DRAFT_415586 [Astrocystis sublimbata]